jgi:hypothetical protein
LASLGLTGLRPVSTFETVAGDTLAIFATSLIELDFSTMIFALPPSKIVLLKKRFYARLGKMQAAKPP